MNEKNQILTGTVFIYIDYVKKLEWLELESLCKQEFENVQNEFMKMIKEIHDAKKDEKVFKNVLKKYGANIIGGYQD